MFTNQMRFTGLSGIDTDQIVRSMMTAESMRFNRVTQQRQLNIWRREAYHGVSAQLQVFQNSFLSMTARNSLRAPSTFNTFTTNITTGGRPGAPGATASSAITIRSQNNIPRSGSIEVVSTARADARRSAQNLVPSVFAANRGIDFEAIEERIADMDDSEIGLSFRVSVNAGTPRDINITAGQLRSATASDIATIIDNRLLAEFGNVGGGDRRITAENVNGEIVFRTALGHEAGFSGTGLRDLGFTMERNAVFTAQGALSEGDIATLRLTGFTFDVTIDGNIETISIMPEDLQGVTTRAELRDAINERLEYLFPDEDDRPITASLAGNGAIMFTAASSDGDVSISGSQLERIGFRFLRTETFTGAPVTNADVAAMERLQFDFRLNNGSIHEIDIDLANINTLSGLVTAINRATPAGFTARVNNDGELTFSVSGITTAVSITRGSGDTGLDRLGFAGVTLTGGATDPEIERLATARSGNSRADLDATLGDLFGGGLTSLAPWASGSVTSVNALRPDSVIAGSNVNIRYMTITQNGRTEQMVIDFGPHQTWDELIDYINERIRNEGFEGVEVVREADNRVTISVESDMETTIAGDLWFSAFEMFSPHVDNANPFTVSPEPRDVPQTVTINDTEITWSSDMTVREFMDAVNSVDGVNMTFNALSRSFTMESTQVGAAGNITFGDGNRQIFDAMGISTDENHANRGTDAIIYLETDGGDRIRMYFERNNFVLDGMEITLGTNAAGALDDSGNLIPGSNVFHFDMQHDVDPLMDIMRDFVEAYNELIASLNAAHTTARPRSGRFSFYEPLTDDQRHAMSETEISNWEAQAKTGMLHRSETIRAIHSTIRQWMMEPLTLEDGTRVHLSQMGITTTRDFRDGGQLEIDEARLRTFLEQHGDRALTLFTNQASVAANTNNRNERLRTGGLSERLNDIINWATSAAGQGTMSIAARAGHPTLPSDGASLNRLISDQDRRLADMLRILGRREEQLFARFSRMEMAIMQANSQMGAMMGMFGQGMM